MAHVHQARPRERNPAAWVSDNAPIRWRSIGELVAEIVEKLAAQREREAAE